MPDVRVCSSSTDLHSAAQFSQHHLLKGLSFPHKRVSFQHMINIKMTTELFYICSVLSLQNSVVWYRGIFHPSQRALSMFQGPNNHSGLVASVFDRAGPESVVKMTLLCHCHSVGKRTKDRPQLRAQPRHLTEEF